jgi:putative transposase
MSKPVAPPITIPGEVYPILERIANSSKAEKRLVERATYILRMGQAIPNIRIATEFKVENNTVKKWRRRWLEGTAKLQTIVAQETDPKKQRAELEREVRHILNDKARPGVAMTYTAEQYCQILQVALEPPEESGRPISNWTPRELAAEVNARGIAGISATQVGRFLKRERAAGASKSVLAESES